MHRYGNQVHGDGLNSLYGDSRAQGFGSEVRILKAAWELVLFIDSSWVYSFNYMMVDIILSLSPLYLALNKNMPTVNFETCFSLLQVKMRILMGTYALSAGYYDAYYKRAQQV